MSVNNDFSLIRYLPKEKFLIKNLFLNIETIAEVTDKLINKLEQEQQDHIEMQPSCLKVVGEFAENFFEEPFLKYCSNKESQNRALQVSLF